MKEKHHGGGMPYFEKDHWEKKVEDINVADGKYSSQMNQLEEYTKSANALASYAKKHKAEH